MAQPFAALDYDAQLDCLTRAAHAALHAYGLVGASVTHVLYVNNATFRVQSSDGSAYALRLHRPGHKPAAWIESELRWLRALHRDTGLRAPLPVATADGALLTGIAVEGVDAPLACALFAWIDGASPTWEHIRLDQIGAAGAYLAHLHDFSSRFVPPPAFARPRLDWEGLFGEDSPYNPGEGAAIFTAQQRAVFAQVEARVGAVMDTLGQSPETFGLIHADFIVKNFLFAGDDLCVIDFDDCGWGYYLYDLAPLLTQMKGEPRYADIYQAYWDGYTRVRPLPPTHQAHLETFIAARHLASCRWIAGHLHNPRIRERAMDILAARTVELRRFLETGAITQRGEQL